MKRLKTVVRLSLIFLSCCVVGCDGAAQEEGLAANEESETTVKNADPVSLEDRGVLGHQTMKRFNTLYATPFVKTPRRAGHEVRISEAWNSVNFGGGDSSLMGRDGCYIVRVDWPGRDPKDAGYFAVGENSRSLDSSLIRIFKDSDGDGKVSASDQSSEIVFAGKILSALCALDGVAYAAFGKDGGDWEVLSLQDTDGDDAPDSATTPVKNDDSIFGALPYKVRSVSDILVDSNSGRVTLYESPQRTSGGLVAPGSSTYLFDIGLDGSFESAQAGFDVLGRDNTQLKSVFVVDPVANDQRVWARLQNATLAGGVELELVDDNDVVLASANANDSGLAMFTLASGLMVGLNLRVRQKNSGALSRSIEVAAIAAKTADIAWIAGGEITASPLRVHGERLPTNANYALRYRNKENEESVVALTVQNTGTDYVDLAFDAAALKSDKQEGPHAMLTILGSDGITPIDIEMGIPVRIP